MKCESLKNKKQKLIKENQSRKNNKDFSNGFEEGVENSFDIFASFVELYNRYKNDVKLLMSEQKNIWKQWVDFYEKQTKIDQSNYLENYNDWLFDYLFSDINKDSSELLSL